MILVSAIAKSNDREKSIGRKHRVSLTREIPLQVINLIKIIKSIGLCEKEVRNSLRFSSNTLSTEIGWEMEKSILLA